MLGEKSADLLVVDEDERTRPAAESWLHSEGYDGHCLPDGRAAVQFLQAYRPKFAVLDLTTLEDEGLDVLETIRRLPRVRDLSLVVYVAVTHPGDPSEGVRAQAYLPRGINWPCMRTESERYVQ
jgi:CheY-like chemotaxis protein